ncbi:hypothetical protein [Rhizobium ruizarguesonis]|uniref:hypothetical protein n=1 Tax=Rhizobium ruizarguesonis TaxID=2081791 RepID=UPI00103053BA|nr:hypothetical protein [Rhizobium ruizarguesonis]TAY79709.1 hypothetical protein ELH86_12495 [Rhizobium ruizarguesonis]TBD21820.1 hypothetical protein ELH23_13480 [Rhizobium ruizarguesonis]
MATTTRNIPSKEQQPPLFIAAFDADGERHEILIEPSQTAPAWFNGTLHISVKSPGGGSVETILPDATRSIAYQQCLNLVASKALWAPTKRLKEWRHSKAELWSLEEVEVHAEPSLMVAEASRQKGESWHSDETRGGPHCIVVVRNADGAVLHTQTDRLFYFDSRRSIGNRSESWVVPQAIIDTDLPGAFWGFTEHKNLVASEMVAQRLLDRVREQETTTPQDVVPLVAAAHAILTHREFLDKYGQDIVERLRRLTDGPSDLSFLRALLEVSMIAQAPDTKEAVLDDVKKSFTRLATQRPLFSETLRWLDAKLSVLVSLISRSAENVDKKFEHDVDTITNTLAHAFKGGQLAVYLGEPNDRELLGAEAQKKTSLM